MEPAQIAATSPELPIRYQKVASLGSSFAAGPSLDPVVDPAAKRSGRNYPHLLANLLGASLVDLTVSGATVATVLSERQRARWGQTFDAQISALPADSDLVTITVGGNDLGYSAGMIRAAVGGWLDQHRATRWLGKFRRLRAPTLSSSTDVERLATGLADIVAAARARAPKARVVLADYLTVFGDSTTTSATVPLSTAQLANFRTLGRQLDEAFALAASRTGADLVKASALSADHALGSDDPWITSFRPMMRPLPFHPTAQGMQEVARAIHHHLGAAVQPT